jgi:hypothetical protein
VLRLAREENPERREESDRHIRLLDHFTADELTGNILHLEQFK